MELRQTNIDKKRSKTGKCQRGSWSTCYTLVLSDSCYVISCLPYVPTPLLIILYPSWTFFWISKLLRSFTFQVLSTSYSLCEVHLHRFRMSASFSLVEIQLKSDVLEMIFTTIVVKESLPQLFLIILFYFLQNFNLKLSVHLFACIFIAYVLSLECKLYERRNVSIITASVEP